MDAETLLFCVSIGGLTIAVVWLAQRWNAWYVNRQVDRFMTEIMARTRVSNGRLINEAGDRPRLEPESRFVVTVTEDGATCVRPDGRTESVRWSDLERVEILTTDDGPLLPDQFWILAGSTGGCVVPWGATGEQELLTRLQTLPDFRNDLIIEAAGLTTNHLLLCWQRTPREAEA